MVLGTIIMRPFCHSHYKAITLRTQIAGVGLELPGSSLFFASFSTILQPGARPSQRG
jgi:hypothetical protein